MQAKSDVAFPGICFWQTKNLQKINFINEGDFRKSALLKVLGIDRSPLVDSFGVTDESEIRKRQEIMRFFIDNPTMGEKLCCLPMENAKLPMDNRSFLWHYQPDRKENLFVELIHRVQALCAKDHVPSEVKAFVDFMLESESKIREHEESLVRLVEDQVQLAASMEGVITVHVDLSSYRRESKVTHSHIFGYRKFSYGEACFVEKKVPRIFKNTFMKIVGGRTVAQWMVDRINAYSRRYYNSTQLLSGEAPKEVQEAVLKRLSIFCETHNMGNICERSYASRAKDALLSFAIRYDGGGLQIKLLDVSVPLVSSQEEEISELQKGRRRGHDYVNDDFPGYSRWEIKKAQKANVQCNIEMIRMQHRLVAAQIAQFMHENGEFAEWQKISADAVDLKFKWYHIQELYKLPDVIETFNTVKAYRDFFITHVKMLQHVISLSQAFTKTSHNANLTMEFPIFLPDDQHLVSFASLVPIRLMSHGVAAEKIVPLMSLPNINGQIIAFTGQNAGGKSTAEEAIIDAVFLAQSGFPIFGTGMSLNIKKQIGMVFLERGSGSTCELLLQKSKKLLEALQSDAHPHKTLLILDEIGTGTQEVDGYEVGKLLLKKLSSSGCSVIFSTQITELAKFAKESLGTACFNFDLVHHIAPGIGGGGINKLMQAVGIDRLLRE